MLRLLVASAHIPGATGSGPGVHVSARFRGVPRSTRVVPEEHSPTWNETLAWPLGTRPLHPAASLTLRLRHWGQPAPQGDLGATTVSLDQLVANPGLPLALSHVPLLDPQGQPTGCTVTLRCSYVPRGTAGDAAVSVQGQVPPPAVSPGTPHHPGKPLAGRREDFQVRVRVIEGHQLQGNDIKPVVTVRIGQHRFRTRIRVGNNPYYNEVFCQNFHRTPAQLVAEPIHIQVLDSRATRAKAVIGVFQVRDSGSGTGHHAVVQPLSPPLPSLQLDVGTVYQAPGHSLSWKWLSLQHPHRPDTGSQGYLRVSLAVLGAGESVPEQEEPAGDEDVEANLLRPPPCAATLQLRIYRAEDLPQAEPTRPCLPSVLPVGGKRGFVAAAVRVSFAGRTLCTRVMPPDANPAWNEVFFFPLRLPPVCDEIQLAILSRSRSSKVLGTATLHLSQISSAGAELEEGSPGFLPCFGPSFLPFYGPRPDPARTPNTDTGVAYRGRVLLELSTHMGTPDGRQRSTIAPEDIARVQRHLPRHRFGLCGIFYSATMVPAGPELLRFELSLGNYGDTGDVTCKPVASVTPHGFPLFDGNRYHYLPWYSDKPVAAVTSSWEDAGHRWDALNLLRTMCRRLERNVAELRDARGDAGGDIGRRLLRQLVQDCRRALPRLEAQPTPTQLDAHLRAARLHLLRRVATAAATPPRAGWDTLLPVAEGWLRRVATLAVEPQAGVPDVLLWLLRGERRVACARIPAPDLMFSRSGPGACGRLCGRIQTLFLVGSGDIRAQLRLRLWLGRVADSGDLPRHLEGTLRVYAETYENQTKLLGKWGPRGLLGCPGFSDSAGKAGLPRHRIRPPKGWRWDGPWTVEPQRRLLLDTETNVGEVLEEVYENESRRLGGEWGPAAVASTDASGTAVPPKEEVACPQGWHVTNGWRVDVTGAVDEAGEWVSPVGTPGQHSPEVVAGAETWEYGSLWGCRFHLQPRTGDMCRRRCWHRRMVPAQPPPVAPLFLLEGSLVLAWGLRGLRSGVRAPSLEVRCGGQTLRTPSITDLATNPNFPINAFLLTLHLPAEEEYVPPIRLRVLDTRDFGYRPEVGQACVRGLGQYCPGSPLRKGLWTRWAHERGHFGHQGHQGHPSPLHPDPCQAAEEEEDEDEDDWWSKFYAATGDKAKSQRGTKRDRLKIYSCELEAVPEFEGLQDFCQTFPLYQPGGHPAAGDDPVPVGEFKGLFRIYPLPEDPRVPPPPRHFQELPPSRPQKCLVRVYIVRAFDLPPRDRNGLCDPYVRISLGTKTLGQRDQYVPNTLEPVFGRLFEVTGTIPLEKDLRVSLLDYDLLPPDQEIGTTTIDLENRLLSRFRAHCGLPALYHTAGPGCWRDQLPPSRALEHFARSRGLPAPEFSAEGTAVTFGDQTFLLSHFESGPPAHQHPGAPRERLALHVLHTCHLVPEHLETRTLYNSTQPGLEQGKVQMWVDVFPASLGPPGPAVDITPRKPQRYELRCVVWNTREVDLGDTNLAGQRMSDIYVTGWLDGLEEQRQRTDVHYRSLQGDGGFNWRFVFSFEYLAAEQLCILPRKEHFWSLDETVLKVPPKLILQVWDNDKFSADEFLGVLELELTRLPRPAQHPRDCTPTLQETPKSSWPWRGTPVPSRLSLFRQRRVGGQQDSGGTDPAPHLPPIAPLQGKLELSLELLTAKEAEERPAGKGREDPNMYPTLPAPVRPEWSFLWLQAPLRGLRYGVWQQHRCRITLVLALLLLLALLLTFVYATPGYLAMKLVNPLHSLHLAGGERPAAGAGKP
ncbi:fer-1-like protein 5 [Theristicus caerulescens]